MATNSLQPGDRFRFGENWKDFLSTISEERIGEAERGLLRLFPDGQLRAAKFLDVGCGSGLSMLAAHRLGAASVDGIDIDQDSVDAARSLLSGHIDGGRFSVRRLSVFDLAEDVAGKYDIVYSWGVLHHTGAMWDALSRTCSIVPRGGRLAIALYRRTPVCEVWKREKRFYASASPPVQKIIRAMYKAAYLGRVTASGQNPFTYASRYKSRGMSWHHDVHDWLGGYPYESTTPEEISKFLADQGFTIERCFEHSSRGLFGSHCDEYVARRS